MNTDKLITGSIILSIIIFILFFKRIKYAFLSIFGGSIDKVEFGGIIFTNIFLWMIWKEGTRTSEWHLFSELYILVVAGAGLTGLGLGKVLEHIERLRSSAPNTKETKIEINEKGTSKVETKETKNDTEAP